uniref:Uncharacterized protein n=1 Tax=Timema douglasi TaxID=61478 RepID=A0A7R8VKM0_TIMDO|nr:unnamed protein product [Timema douglasi]
MMHLSEGYGQVGKGYGGKEIGRKEERNESCGRVEEKVSRGRIEEKVSRGRVEEVSRGRVEEVSRGKVEEKVSRGRVEDKVSHGRVEEKVSHGRVEEKVSRGKVEEKVSRGKVEEKVSRGRVEEKFNIAICFPGPWVKLSGGTMFKSCTLLLQKGSGDMKIGAIRYLTLLLVLNCGHGSKKTPKSALSGLLCASLNFIDAANSLSPELTLRPAGVVDNKPVNSSYLRYATLPREIVCTENLTPWKKLLPCDSKDTSCSKMAVELRQTVSLVYDIVIVGAGSQDWSLRKLFGMGLGGACPLATMSNIYIDITSNKTETPFQLVPPAPAVTTSIRGGYETILAVYDVKSLKISSMFNVAVVHTQIPQVFNINSPPVIFANRYIVGYGQERGGIVTKIHNNHWKSLDIVYLENIPWFLPVYFHTLKIVANGKEIKPVMKRYIPGKERTRPYYLEVALKLPGRSVTEISIDFDYVFLKWQEYPPDANHGFYIGSAIITALLPVGKNYTGLPQDGSTITSRLRLKDNESQSGPLLWIKTKISALRGVVQEKVLK